MCVESGDCPILEEPRYDSSTNNREKESEGKNHVCSTLCVSMLSVSVCVSGCEPWGVCVNAFTTVSDALAETYTSS